MCLLHFTLLPAQSWVPLGPDDYNQSFSNYVEHLSSVVNNDGIIYAVASDYLNGAKALVRKFENGHWETVGATHISEGIVEFTDIAVSKNENIPYVAYVDQTGDLNVKRFLQALLIQLFQVSGPVVFLKARSTFSQTQVAQIFLLNR